MDPLWFAAASNHTNQKCAQMHVLYLHARPAMCILPQVSRNTTLMADMTRPAEHTRNLTPQRCLEAAYDLRHDKFNNS